MTTVPRILLAAAAGLELAASPARAQDYGADKPLTAVFDLRLAAADGERGWLDGGFGKGRFGGEAGARPTEAAIVWTPAITFDLDATIAAVAQRDQQHAIDLSEAFISWRGRPAPIRLSGRAGLFWPPVSLEHGGPEWAVRETISPSAINSWIGEEVKVGGVEASAAGLGGRVRLTAGVFGWNDTSGTLLAFRGWALHDQKATAFGLQLLPPLDAFMGNGRQATRTRPVLELDDRPGWYLRLTGRPAPTLHLQLFHYDNRGDPEAVNAARQWGWRTRFDEAGVRWQATAGWTLTAQAMRGTTKMGFRRGGRIWVDTRFRAAYLLATRAIGPGSISARLDAFGARGRGSIAGSQDSEHGWAATIAGRLPLGAHATLLVEGLRIDSTRPARVRDGAPPRQRQLIGQAALRLKL